MINVSNEFKQHMGVDDRKFLVYLDIVLADGTELPTLTNSDLWEGGFKLDDGVTASGQFTIGSCIMNKLTLTLNNIYDKFSAYNFDRAIVTAYIGLELSSGRIEKIRKGIFTVDEPTYNGSTITLECLDNMYKLDRDYADVKTTYPANLGTIVRDICNVCGVTLLTTTFDYSTYQVSKRPDDEALTCRQVLAYCAQIACKFARFDTYGRLILGWFEQGVFENGDTLDGGYFDGGPTFNISKLSKYLNTTNGMECLVNNIKKGVEVTTMDGVDWFLYNGTVASKLYVSGYQWIGFGSAAVHLTVCRCDGAMYYLYRQEGEVNGSRFLKIRWEGYTHKLSQEKQYALKFEVFLLDSGVIFLNVVQIPTNSSYLGVSFLFCGNQRLSLDVINEKQIAMASDYGNSWRIINTAGSYESGDDADGGTFAPWNTGYVADAGTFQDQNKFHHLYYYSSLNVSTDDVVITGVQVTEEFEETEKVKKQTYLYGDAGYILAIAGNKFVEKGKGQDVVDYLGPKLVGLRFRPMSGQFLGDPTVEAGDLAYVTDRKQRTYNCMVTNLTFTVGNYMTVTCDAETPSKNSASRYSELTQAIVEARKNTQAQISEYDLAVQQLTSLITQSFGVYKTEEVQTDGSIVYYMHNKPTIAQSTTIWKMTADAFAVSTDGGKTWKAGMDSSGNAVVNVLSAIGVNAEWVNTGFLSASRIRGGDLIIGGENNKFGTIKLVSNGGYSNGSIDMYGYSFTDNIQDLEETTLKANTSGITITSKKYGDLFGCGHAHLVATDDYMAEVDGRDGVSLRVNNSYTGSGSSVFLQMLPEMTLLTTGLTIYETLNVWGTKSRIISTPNYNKRLQYCYEMPSPMFGDTGEGITDEKGECYVYLDDIFTETVSADIEYQVFIQKEGQGDLWISEKNPVYFVVNGTENLKFAWEIKVKQRNYEYERLEFYDKSNSDKEVDYESEYVWEIEQLIKEQEEILYEAA